MSDERDEELRLAAIRRRLELAARPDGFVPFDRFMEIALYSEDLGYYTASANRFGPGGDFYTAAHVHPIFGASIARRLVAVRRALGTERPFRIVEAGAGDGRLASTILEALSRSGIGGAGDVSYHLIEPSREGLRRAKELVAPVARAAGISLVEQSSLEALGPFEGVVLANELLDAQPARRLRWDGRAWHEIGVRVTEDRVIPSEAELEELVPPPDPPGAIEVGTIFEPSPAAENWIRCVADHLIRGELLILDYGLEESELLAGHPGGTLAGVRQHRNVERPWEAPGAADLSVFVNFSRIRAVARRSGLIELTDRPQAQALGAWGLPEELERAVAAAGSTAEQVKIRLAAKNLLFGFERFRALEFAAPASVAELTGVTSPGATGSSAPAPRSSPR
jgi:SAM-dependent MidA family methyltransferase